MENSSDIIGNRSRDLPACSAVPQPTDPPRTPDREVLSHFVIRFSLATVSMDVEVLAIDPLDTVFCVFSSAFKRMRWP